MCFCCNLLYTLCLRDRSESNAMSKEMHYYLGNYWKCTIPGAVGSYYCFGSKMHNPTSPCLHRPPSPNAASVGERELQVYCQRRNHWFVQSNLDKLHLIIVSSDSEHGYICLWLKSTFVHRRSLPFEAESCRNVTACCCSSRLLVFFLSCLCALPLTFCILPCISEGLESSVWYVRCSRHTYQYVCRTLEFIFNSATHSTSLSITLFGGFRI